MCASSLRCGAAYHPLPASYRSDAASSVGTLRVAASDCAAAGRAEEQQQRGRAHGGSRPRALVE